MPLEKMGVVSATRPPSRPSAASDFARFHEDGFDPRAQAGDGGAPVVPDEPEIGAC